MLLNLEIAAENLQRLDNTESKRSELVKIDFKNFKSGNRINHITNQKPNLRSPEKYSLKRLEFKIVKRILLNLYETGNMKRTNLALRSNLSYRSFTLYLDWLGLLELVNKTSIDGNIVLSLSERGRRLYLQKFSNMANEHYKINIF